MKVIRQQPITGSVGKESEADENSKTTPHTLGGPHLPPAVLRVLFLKLDCLHNLSKFGIDEFLAGCRTVILLQDCFGLFRLVLVDKISR